MGIDFAPIGAKLMGIDLSQAKLQKSNLNTVDLRFANFAKADRTGATFGKSTKVTLAQLALLVERGVRIQPCRIKTA